MKKAIGGVVDNDLPDVQPVQNNYVANPAAEEYYKKLAKRDRYFRENIMTIKDPEARDRKFAEYADFSVFKDILPFIPINVKQYAYHMAGGKGDVDINDLTKKEQEAYYRYAQEIMASGELPLDQDSSVMMDYPNYGTKGGYADVVPIKNLGLSDEQLEAWKRGELVINYPGGRNGAVESYSYEEFLEKYPGALDSDGQSIGDLITNMQDPNYVAKTFTGKADINYNKDSNTITVTDNYNHNRGPKATTKGIIEAFKADPSLYAALKAGALLKNADGSVVELDLGSPEFVQSYPTGYATGGEANNLQAAIDLLQNFADVGSIKPNDIQSLMSEVGIKPIGETSVFKMAMTVLSPEQKLKKIKILKKYFDKMRQAESLEKSGSALGDLSDAAKLRKGIPYNSSKSIQKELDQLQGVEKLDTDLLAILKKQYNL